jgi:hypothetical protein
MPCRALASDLAATTESECLRCSLRSACRRAKGSFDHAGPEDRRSPRSQCDYRSLLVERTALVPPQAKHTDGEKVSCRCISPRLFTAAARAGLRLAPESRSQGACPHLLRSFTTRIHFTFYSFRASAAHIMSPYLLEIATHSRTVRTRFSRFLGSGRITDNTEATHMDRLLCGWQHECWLYHLLVQLLRLTRECTQQGYGRQCGRWTIMIVVCYIE